MEYLGASAEVGAEELVVSSRVVVSSKLGTEYLRARVEVGAEALQIDGLEVQPHLRA